MTVPLALDDNWFVNDFFPLRRIVGTVGPRPTLRQSQIVVIHHDAVPATLPNKLMR